MTPIFNDNSDVSKSPETVSPVNQKQQHKSKSAHNQGDASHRTNTEICPEEMSTLH